MREKSACSMLASFRCSTGTRTTSMRAVELVRLDRKPASASTTLTKYDHVELFLPPPQATACVRHRRSQHAFRHATLDHGLDTDRWSDVDGRQRACPAVNAYASSLTVRSFFTDFTPGTCQTVQAAWALVSRLDTSPLSDTTPALVSAWIPATLRA